MLIADDTVNVIKDNIQSEIKYEDIIKEEIERFNNENKLINKSDAHYEAQVNSIIRCFIEGHISSEELGGLTALRGFIYQYYVAIYNIMKMLTGKDNWVALLYELGDDITLISHDEIRFIQVKTEKEDGKSHNVTVGGLTKRENKFNSWLDKLFYNAVKFESKKDALATKFEINDNYNIKFELATNMSYYSNDIAVYSDREKDRKPGDELAQKLSEEIKIAVDGDEVTYKFEDVIPAGVEWCLDRFSISHLGHTDYLWLQIQYLIIQYVKGSDMEISRRITQKILLQLIQYTHDDNVNSEDKKKQLVFHKKDLEELIMNFEKQSRNEIIQEREKDLIKKEFDQVFEEIKVNIETRWKAPMKSKLLETYFWFRSSLDEIQKQDPFIYEKFVNRLFYLNNCKVWTSLTTSGDRRSLHDSLWNIIFYMTFYSQRTLINDKDPIFVLKDAENTDDKKYVFAIFNGRNIDTYSECKQKVGDKASECSVFQCISDDVCCFIIDSRSDTSKRKNRFLDSSEKITATSEEFSITTKTLNIRFYDKEHLLDFQQEVFEGLETNEIEYEKILEQWNLGLN